MKYTWYFLIRSLQTSRQQTTKYRSIKSGRTDNPIISERTKRMIFRYRRCLELKNAPEECEADSVTRWDECRLRGRPSIAYKQASNLFLRNKIKPWASIFRILYLNLISYLQPYTNKSYSNWEQHHVQVITSCHNYHHFETHFIFTEQVNVEATTSTFFQN